MAVFLVERAILNGCNRTFLLRWICFSLTQLRSLLPSCWTVSHRAPAKGPA